jgi:hypothetical protein
MLRATAIANAPIDAGWSTTTSTRPCPANSVNSSRSAASSFGKGRSASRRPARSTATAWWVSRATSTPQNTSTLPL